MTKQPTNYNTSNSYKQQSAKLRQVGQMDRGRQKCPNCESRCSGYAAYHPEWSGWYYWCYVCGYKVAVPAVPTVPTKQYGSVDRWLEKVYK